MKKKSIRVQCYGCNHKWSYKGKAIFDKRIKYIGCSSCYKKLSVAKLKRLGKWKQSKG